MTPLKFSNLLHVRDIKVTKPYLNNLRREKKIKELTESPSKTNTVSILCTL